MWADEDYELVKQFQVLKYLTIDTWKGLVRFLFAYTLQLFAYSMRIFELKKIFLTSSKHFTRTNLKKHIIELATLLIYMNMKCLDDVRHSQYFQFVSCSFITSWPPKYLIFKKNLQLIDQSEFDTHSTMSTRLSQSSQYYSVLSRMCERLSDFECFFSDVGQNGPTWIRKVMWKLGCVGNVM